MSHESPPSLAGGVWANAFAGRSVLVTGHTGFKGSWMALWLHELGAKVTGLALDPPSRPNHYDAIGLSELLEADLRGDIRDGNLVRQVVADAAPEIVFHMAAQPILRESVREPRETFDVNVMGTVSVLDAVRTSGRPMAVVVVTSDKCYRNDGQVWGYRENDPLGGRDPYSASKAGAELVVDAYRSSYFAPDEIVKHGVRLASVRAGNVIGGGDWAADRIVPDAIRALSVGKDLEVRHPGATRPWQHVLEPLSGYLRLAAELYGSDEPARWTGAWNFGPLQSEEATVARLSDAVVAAWGTGRWVPPPAPVRDLEEQTLRIAADKSIAVLGWRPRWGFAETVRRTVGWYRTYYDRGEASVRDVSIDDIRAHEE